MTGVSDGSRSEPKIDDTSCLSHQTELQSGPNHPPPPPCLGCLGLTRMGLSPLRADCSQTSYCLWSPCDVSKAGYGLFSSHNPCPPSVMSLLLSSLYASKNWGKGGLSNLLELASCCWSYYLKPGYFVSEPSSCDGPPWGWVRGTGLSRITLWEVLLTPRQSIICFARCFAEVKELRVGGCQLQCSRGMRV